MTSAKPSGRAGRPPLRAVLAAILWLPACVPMPDAALAEGFGLYE